MKNIITEGISIAVAIIAIIYMIGLIKSMTPKKFNSSK